MFVFVPHLDKWALYVDVVNATYSYIDAKVYIGISVNTTFERTEGLATLEVFFQSFFLNPISQYSPYVKLKNIHKRLMGFKNPVACQIPTYGLHWKTRIV